MVFADLTVDKVSVGATAISVLHSNGTVSIMGNDENDHFKKSEEL